MPFFSIREPLKQPSMSLSKAMSIEPTLSPVFCSVCIAFSLQEMFVNESMLAASLAARHWRYPLPRSTLSLKEVSSSSLSDSTDWSCQLSDVPDSPLLVDASAACFEFKHEIT
jgi:hypothetical protein